MQSIPTPDGALYFDADSSPADRHLTAAEFAQAFKESKQYKRILEKLDDARKPRWVARQNRGLLSSRGTSQRAGDEEANNECSIRKELPAQFAVFYQNSFFRSLGLNFKRHFTLWTRDTGFIIGRYLCC